MLIDRLKEQITNKKIRIVFPETDDVRIFNAAKRLASEQLLTPVMIGHKESYEQVEGMEFIDPATYQHLASLKASVLERRAGKLTSEQADELLLQPTFFGTALIYSGKADGLIAGATQSTGDTVRPALQLIKTKPNISKTFGYFIMIRDEELYLMGDCAINPDPSAKELAEFAIELAAVSNGYGIEPKIAMLSFSTAGSADTIHTQKVREATVLAKAMAPSVLIDGEMQFDAAVDPVVGQMKFPGSKVAGYANTFVFPDLNAGNIGYKMIQRLGGFEAVGPFLAGLNAPVNDLSRGCSEEDVYKTAIVTASQTLIHD
jgi:phosphate acetyltransferase